jgi:hypothetical protein
VGNATNWQQVFANADRTVALDNSTNIWSWGVNAQGELGIGTVGASSYVPVAIQCPTSSTDLLALDATFQVFPNPFSDIIRVRSEQLDFYKCTFEIKNILGTTLVQPQLLENGQSIDLSHLSSGTYILSTCQDGMCKSLIVNKLR